MTLDTDAGQRRCIHPIVFLILYLPFGVSGGYLAGALGFLLGAAGVSTLALGGLLALAIAPHAFKVLWAPLVDTTLSVKTWYRLAVALAALSLGATGFLPLGGKTLPVITVFVLLTSVAVTFAGMACESLMANGTAPHQKGRAGGWSQAGNVGGAGLGGGAGIALATHSGHPWVASCVTGAAMVACAAALMFAPEPPRDHRRPSYFHSLRVVAEQCWQAVRSRGGLLTTAIFLLPIGASAAANLFTPIARQWHAAADLISGLAAAGGLVTMGGAIVGGWLCDRMDRRAAYALFGVVQAVIAAGMAIGPRTPAAFIVFTLAYAATVGLTYAAFAAVTLEVIGAGAAATKYNLFACLSNIPIAYMDFVDGWANSRWKAGGMLTLEAGLAIVAVIVFTVLVQATRQKPVLAVAA